MDANVIAALVGAGSAVVTSLVGSFVGHAVSLHKLRRESEQKNRNHYFQRQLTAHMKLWALLKPTSSHDKENGIVETKEGGSFILSANLAKFRKEITNFFYSENGIFLSRNVRHAVFDSLDYLDELVAASGGVEEVKIGTKGNLKKVNNSFRWMREKVRQDAGLQDLRFEKSEIGAKDSSNNE